MVINVQKQLQKSLHSALGCGDRAFESHYSDHICTLILIQYVSRLGCSFSVQSPCAMGFRSFIAIKTADRDLTPGRLYTLRVLFVLGYLDNRSFIGVSLTCPMILVPYSYEGGIAVNQQVRQCRLLQPRIHLSAPGVFALKYLSRSEWLSSVVAESICLLLSTPPSFFKSLVLPHHKIWASAFAISFRMASFLYAYQIRWSSW